MTAAFFGASAGNLKDGGENAAAYLRFMIDVLGVKDNKTWLVKAASGAQKAADKVFGARAPPPVGA